ncbi:MAG: DUF924 family protein [Gammaproteobacteria bacterium]|nr:DUF924 family protein [Gammaproteobacteria bacterium]
MQQETEKIIEFWFGSLKSMTDLAQDKSAMWFVNGSDYDDMIRENFLSIYKQACDGHLEAWQESPRTLLALIILLDQFSRHIYRNSAQSFAQDQKVVEIVKKGIDEGLDQSLYFIERKFFYMPLMHAEDIVTQELAVSMFTKLRDEVPDELKHVFSKSLSFAESHFYVISNFGRFPELNQILGRESTPAEIEFLATGKYRFL